MLSSDVITQILRELLAADTPLHSAQRVVVSHALETHASLLQAELTDALKGCGRASELAAFVAGLSGQPSLVVPLIDLAQRAESEGRVSALRYALRSLGQIGSDQAREYLFTVCKRYLDALQPILLAAGVEALAYLGAPAALPLMETVLRSDHPAHQQVKPFSCRSKAIAALLLARFNSREGIGFANAALQGVHGRDVEETTLRLFPSIAPDAYALLPGLCILMLSGPTDAIGLLISTITSITDVQPLVGAVSQTERLIVNTNKSLIREMLGGASKSSSRLSPSCRVRLALALGSTGDSRAVDDLLREVMTNETGLASYARMVLIYGPLLEHKKVQDAFAPRLNQAEVFAISTIECDAIQSRRGCTPAQQRCIAFLRQLCETKLRLLKASIICRTSYDTTVSSHDMQLTHMLPLQTILVGALGNVADQQTDLLRLLLVTSPRDMRLRCVYALGRIMADTSAHLLREYYKQEPCATIRTAILDAVGPEGV